MNTQPSARDTTDDQEIRALVERILTVYHRPLYRQLPQLTAAARDLLAVHGLRSPEARPLLTRVGELVGELRTSMERHLEDEERYLFHPLLQAADAPIDPHFAEFEHDHGRALGMLAELRTITGGYVTPPGAPSAWRGLYALLEQIETDLEEHLRIESDELFARLRARAERERQAPGRSPA